MAIKLVKYTGETATYKYCSSPKLLEKGKIYEVAYEDVMDCQTNYHLKDVDGEFNSVWFTDVPFYFVTATRPPKQNERFLCYKLEPYGNKFSRVTVLTSPVQSIRGLSNKLYMLYTNNSCYLCYVL